VGILVSVDFTCLLDVEWWRVADMLLVPKYVFWVQDYPKTASGKIQKFKLQEDGLQLLKEGKGMQ